MSKHTQGNWEVIKLEMADFKQVVIASDKRDSVIAHMYLPEYKIDDETLANAQLMAAAPEMFSKFETLVNSALFQIHFPNMRADIMAMLLDIKKFK